MLFRKTALQFLRSALTIFVLVLLAVTLLQRQLLFHPSHGIQTHGLKPWKREGATIGYCREVASPQNVWLLIHGNAGQAADRAYALPAFSREDSVFILEYPGYGSRKGSPSATSMNDAAKQAYELLRAQFQNVPVCIAAESIGTGPACTLATHTQPPDKIVLVVPFDKLTHVASLHFPFLPVNLLLLDRWNNVQALSRYNGPVEIFGASDDRIIPIICARTLAAGKPTAVFHEISGGHNDWSLSAEVNFRNP